MSSSFASKAVRGKQKAVRKSSGAFRQISEAAEILGVPASALRFWEGRFPQIKPLTRNGKRRYYRPFDIDLLAGIKYFLYTENMSLRLLGELLKKKGMHYVANIGAEQIKLEHQGRAGVSSLAMQQTAKSPATAESGFRSLKTEMSENAPEHTTSHPEGDAEFDLFSWASTSDDFDPEVTNPKETGSSSVYMCQTVKISQNPRHLSNLMPSTQDQALLAEILKKAVDLRQILSEKCVIT